jgi:hypothetical protein
MMAEVKIVYEVKIDQPNLPEGEPIQIPGLGTFENGGTYDVSEAEAEAYRSYHTRQVPKIDPETKAYLGADVELGPSLADVAESMYGVTVEEVDKTVTVEEGTKDFPETEPDETPTPAEPSKPAVQNPEPLNLDTVQHDYTEGSDE